MTETLARERGAALVTAMTLLVVVGTLTGLAIERSTALSHDDRRHLSATAAAFAADGGLVYARHLLQRRAGNPAESTATGDTWTLRIGRADVTIHIAPLATDPSLWHATSTARCGSGPTAATKTLTATLGSCGGR